MPTYDYECNECGNVQEVFHSMTKKPKVFCEKCKGATTKIISEGAGIAFHGTGFYTTDYKYPEQDKREVGSIKRKLAQGDVKAAEDIAGVGSKKVLERTTKAKETKNKKIRRSSL